MESVYYVLCWACHRRCRHCYDSRFHPYVRGALAEVVAEAQRCFPRIVANLPERMTYFDRDAPLSDGTLCERTGRIVLAGGEVLLDAVREPVLYPVLEALADKYRGAGGVRLVVQTTGDRITERILDELLARGVWLISVAGMDDFHVGMEGDRKHRLQERLTRMFERAGMRPSPRRAPERRRDEEEAGPLYAFFGATPDAWIGRLWPRGRAWANGLSTATLADNFCNAWSGGLGFLRHREAGSEVSVEPDGSVYPCCLKTRVPIGNLCEERLTDILDDLAGHPAFEAIAAGAPQRMGLAFGWSEERFLEASRTTTPAGRPYANLCIGCDRFHAAVLAPVIAERRAQRLARRAAAE